MFYVLCYVFFYCCIFRDGLNIHEELQALSTVKRFDMVMMFLARDDKKCMSFYYILCRKTFTIFLCEWKKNPPIESCKCTVVCIAINEGG